MGWEGRECVLLAGRGEYGRGGPWLGVWRCRLEWRVCRMRAGLGVSVWAGGMKEGEGCGWEVGVAEWGTCGISDGCGREWAAGSVVIGLCGWPE